MFTWLIKKAYHRSWYKYFIANIRVHADILVGGLVFDSSRLHECLHIHLYKCSISINESVLAAGIRTWIRKLYVLTEIHVLIKRKLLLTSYHDKIISVASVKMFSITGIVFCLVILGDIRRAKMRIIGVNSEPWQKSNSFWAEKKNKYSSLDL